MAPPPDSFPASPWLSLQGVCVCVCKQRCVLSVRFARICTSIWVSVCVSAVALSDTGCQMLGDWHRKAVPHEDSELAEWSLLI